MNKKLTILAVVLVIVFGLIYLKSKQDSNISMQQIGDQQQEAMNQVSADDSSDTIAQELEDTNTDDLGQEFIQIDAEIEAAVSETP